MSTLHKVKAYFGMAPMDDYEDEYYDDRAPSRGFPRPRFDDGYGGRYDRDYEDPRDPAATCATPTTRRPAATAAAMARNRRTGPASSSGLRT